MMIMMIYYLHLRLEVAIMARLVCLFKYPKHLYSKKEPAGIGPGYEPLVRMTCERCGYTRCIQACDLPAIGSIG